MKQNDDVVDSPPSNTSPEVSTFTNMRHQFELYTPLTSEEADENLLADISKTLNTDVSSGECDNVINNISKVSTHTEMHNTKRRRLSNSDDTGLLRKVNSKTGETRPYYTHTFNSDDWFSSAFADDEDEFSDILRKVKSKTGDIRLHFSPTFSFYDYVSLVRQD